MKMENREIKFRAWDKALNKMSKPFTFGEVLNFTDENGIGSIKSLTDGHRIMQYTGLKDKKGTPMYEGDIIKRLYSYEVRFKNGGYYGYNGKWNLNTSEISTDMTVIGNRYENPELLNHI